MTGLASTHVSEELALYEATIERGLETFYEVGAALMAIRDARLYREAYATFEEYCRDRWGMSKTHANRLVDAAQVREDLTPIGVSLPATESQARPLALVPREERAEVWSEVVTTAPDGRVTAVHAAQVVDQHRQPERLTPLFSSASPEWYTPAHVIAAVLDFFDEIDLDPCSNSREMPVVPAREHFIAADDGLVKRWWGRVYLNPPYGDEVGRWVGKAVAAYADCSIEAAILLVAARTDTDWFAPLLDFAICFIHGRLKFDGPNGKGNSAGFPSALVYLGDDYEGFAAAVSHLGPVVRRYDARQP